MKALELLKTSKTVTERADSYAKSIKKDLEYKVIRALEQKKEGLESKVFDLQDFNLHTNHNEGKVANTQAECQARFEQLINAEYELELVSLELEAKRKIFNKYFDDGKVETAQA